ncbi:hypothetical protein JK364_15285 [Streptomyces sp. 110]|uniref:Peptidase inhibitor family I36 n=1 Tax=Streptomyces endocoffeicus TaxID=2898945 RepID=A0ABS1PMU7_9ACTN|nr:hypothetical protein [Streptomyces endocoffeicus]MBL1113746.1 hypothetical protein [Streptomyces endocoffeicus]
MKFRSAVIACLATSVVAVGPAVTAHADASQANAGCTSNMCYWYGDNYHGNIVSSGVNRGICYRPNDLVASAKIRMSHKVRFWALPGCRGQHRDLGRGNYPNMDTKIGFSPQSYRRV